jgi:predicted branched-subunit amino acid permease
MLLQAGTLPVSDPFVTQKPDSPRAALPPFWRGMRQAAGLPSLVLMASLVGVGGLTRDIGFPMWAGVLSTVLIWAGPAQVLLFGSIAAGAALPAIAVAVSLSSIRFLPMVVSLLPLLKGPRVGTWRLILAAHFIAVTAWVEGRRLLPAESEADRWPFFIGFGTMVMFAASFATGAGYFLIGALPPALAAALLFTTPMFFTLSLAAGSRVAADWTALALGFLLAPVAAHVAGQDFDLLLIGLVGGSIAYLVHRRRRDR